jgi:hypothetical protein
MAALLVYRLPERSLLTVAADDAHPQVQRLRTECSCGPSDEVGKATHSGSSPLIARLRCSQTIMARWLAAARRGPAIKV